MITMRLHEGEHPSLQFPLLSRRYSRMFLAVHEQTRNQLIDRVLLEMQLRLTASGETHRWNRESMIPGIRERMALASHKEIGRGRKWMAHLQRADFEVLAKGLSLSDINRYQFRRNRPHSEGIPVFQAGGGD